MSFQDHGSNGRLYIANESLRRTERAALRVLRLATSHKSNEM
jgi:hypothetical protein